MVATTDGKRLLRHILSNPDDDTARLVYADWLEESGRQDRADFIRAGVEFTQIVRDNHEHDRPGYVSSCPICLRHDDLLDTIRGLGRSGTLGRIMADEQPFPGEWSWIKDELVERTDGVVRYLLRNGFVWAVELPTDHFIKNAAALFSSQPVTRVTLTDRSPWHSVRASRQWGWDEFEGHISSYPTGADPEELPEFIIDQFQPRKYSGHPDAASARAALSDACVRWGSRQARKQWQKEV